MLVISIILILSIIVVQDVRLRAVYWFLFPLVFILGLLRIYPDFNVMNMLLNLAFLTVLMLLLSVYVSLRQRKLTNITKGFFSWGDILFLLALIPYFEFQLYIYFVTFGSIFCLLCHILIQLVKKQDTIPFAAYLSILTIFFLAFEYQIKQLISPYH